MGHHEDETRRSEPADALDEADPTDQSGSPFLVSGFIALLIAVLVALLIIGIVVLN